MIQVRQQSNDVIGKKRKSVKFAEPEMCLYESATSTHEFLTKNVGKISEQAWEDLAETFNCSKDLIPEEDAVLMEELLELCSFFKEEEDTFGFESNVYDEEDDEDSDDEEWLINLRSYADKQKVFVQSSELINRVSLPSRHPSVGDLRFKSQLQLKSSLFSGAGDDIDSCVSVATCSSKQTISACFSSACEDLESAFKGIIQGDNSTENRSSHQQQSQNFWDSVEF